RLPRPQKGRKLRTSGRSGLRVRAARAASLGQRGVGFGWVRTRIGPPGGGGSDAAPGGGRARRRHPRSRAGRPLAERPAHPGLAQSFRAMPLELRPGDRYGAYEVLDVLGRGAFASVYRVRAPQLTDTAALKLSHHPVLDHATAQRALREISVLR